MNATNELQLSNTRYQQLADSLRALRAIAGVSQEQLSATIGISRQTYMELEGKKRFLSHKLYLLLLFYFDYNQKTHTFLRQLGLFPEELVLQINNQEGST